ncbi:MAG: hypothetical protein A3D99_01070 [Candidatus Andersenbacteria bacterium RIFCSPHIGHO2_12_FULL_45_11]|uniref:Four helix bundle protein n=1 Tax=Candidatus Andersenbacteria bacterium RIFCSPHIGHO2_12_FULL_45_11 TaxID=1797281 RepID=A0A1G1X5D8_9BACT|nr:MAG: hypothetical protein A3D99_01070 [Candidatus Andersenbacteria bacterium RIFCSPHIGHO2_12_FULL_45_11]
MTEEIIIQSISVNLLRMSEWYFKDSKNNRAVCERYLMQSKKLAQQITNSGAKKYTDQLETISFSTTEAPEKTAERFLTLGVLLHQI